MPRLTSYGPRTVARVGADLLRSCAEPTAGRITWKMRQLVIQAGA